MAPPTVVIALVVCEVLVAVLLGSMREGVELLRIGKGLRCEPMGRLHRKWLWGRNWSWFRGRTSVRRLFRLAVVVVSVPYSHELSIWKLRLLVNAVPVGALCSVQPGGNGESVGAVAVGGDLYVDLSIVTTLSPRHGLFGRLWND
jgi:hypothetical protein